MLTDELDTSAEAVRLMAGPVDALCHALRCLVNGHVETVATDYSRNAVLLRYCDSLYTQEHEVLTTLVLYQGKLNYALYRWHHRYKRAVYYGIALGGALNHVSALSIYKRYTTAGKTSANAIFFKSDYFSDADDAHVPYFEWTSRGGDKWNKWNISAA